MPIKSYLAYPHEGQKKQLTQALTTLSKCEVIPAQNKEVLVVLTDTQTEAEEQRLKIRLDAISSLKLLAMVAGFKTPQKD